VIRSPNIWDHPEVYELENLGVDRAGLIESAMEGLHPLAGARVLDVGCGTGFHLPRFVARGAREVVGVEPHPPLAVRAEDRLRNAGLHDRARVTVAGAESIPLRDDSIDVVHARWAYFFGAGSEPGLAEVRRVLAPGGVVCVIDNDATRSTFGAWFRRTHPAYDPVAVERFWRRQAFERIPLSIAWTHRTREDFEAVVRIEFAPGDADRILAEHAGTVVDYAVNLWWWRHP
jgi:ubiquinone/menaquinone biosynthesis C-methylase UbiE